MVWGRCQNKAGLLVLSLDYEVRFPELKFHVDVIAWYMITSFEKPDMNDFMMFFVVDSSLNVT